jgi:hypothetical protein
MPSWPSSLPKAPLLEGYGESPPDLILRSQTDVGWARTRRRASAGPTRITATYAMTGAQLAIFEGFVAGDIGERTLAFDWPHPRTGQTVSVRMTAIPQITPAPGADRWRVGVSLETMP